MPNVTLIDPNNQPQDSQQRRPGLAALLPGAGYTLVRTGQKAPIGQGWQNSPHSAKDASVHLNAGGNIGLLCGYADDPDAGYYYLFDLDRDAVRAYSCPHLEGSVYIWRDDDRDRVKVAFRCRDKLPVRRYHNAGVELLGVGSHGVIAGVHPSRAAIQWDGEQIPLLDIETVDAILENWTEGEIEAEQQRQHKEPGQPNDEAVRRSVATVAGFCNHAGIEHTGMREHDGTGRKFVLRTCPFNPKDNPHADDTAAAIMVYADGRIGATCHHARCQEIIKQQPSGWQYLKDKYNFHLRPTPEELVAFHESILNHKAWLSTPDAAKTFKDAGVRYTTGRKIVDAHADICAEWGRPDVAPGFRLLALRAGVTKTTVVNALPKLVKANLFTVDQPDDDDQFTPLTITAVFQKWYSDRPSESYTVPLLKNYSAHRCDDVFRNNHADYKKRKPDALDPLGDSALPVLLTLQDGDEKDVDEIAAELGINPQTVRRVLGKAYGYGMVSVTTGRHNRKRYSLSESWKEDLDMLRPNMSTYGVQFRRELDYAEHRVRMARKSGDLDRLRRAEESLERIVSDVWTGNDNVPSGQWVRPWRSGWRWIRWDKDEREAEFAQLRDQVQALRVERMPVPEIRRHLQMAGWSAEDVSRALVL